MALTKLVLDRQAVAQTFPFGTTAASGQGLVTINNGTAALTNTVLDIKGSASVAGNLVVTGDLQITGSVDSIAVTNTNVKDKTITVNDGGSTAGAVGSGLRIEGDANTTIGAITYAAGSGSKFQIGDGTTQVDIADTATSQTLTNKIISGSTNTITNVSLTTGVTGTLPLANGGTNATTQAGAANNVLPSQTSNSGKYLTTDGSNVSWAAVAAVNTFKRTTVTGTQDGANKIFTISSAVVASSEQVILNGQVLNPGGTNDYTISGTTVTFTAGYSAPTSTDAIQVFGAY